MQRWTVGRVELLRIVDEELALPPDALAEGWTDPIPAWCEPRFVTADGPLLAFSALAVRAADGTRIVIDPWLANDAARTRDDAGTHVERLLDELTAAGFPADEVDVVVLSHIDGIGWITRPPSESSAGWTPTFPNARYVLATDEYDAWIDDEVIGPQIAVLTANGQLDRIEPPILLAPGISLDPAPGHSPGHLAVRIESDGRLAIYAGHLFITPLQVADPAIANDEDPQIASGVRHAILGELSDRGGLLLTSLVGGPGGGIVHESWDGSGYRLEPI